MDKIKEIYQHNGTDWGDAIPIGVDAENVDVTDEGSSVPLNNLIKDMTQEELQEFLGNLPSGIPMGYVKKSGDTMTGNLYIQANDIDASKTNNNIDVMRYPTAFNVLDSQGRTLVRQEARINPNGSIGWYIYARNYNTNGEEIAQKGIIMDIDKSGNTSYYISEPQKFAEALGQGTKITPTFRQCTNGAYTTCRKIGNLVILSFNINVTTATESYDYLTGLPKAVEGFAGSSAIGTQAGRWWVTTDGTLRFDGTPTTGWHNGNITYICQ